MSDAQSPRLVASAPSRISTAGNTVGHPPSILCFHLHLPQPSLEALEANCLAACQTESIQRETVDVDATTTNNESDGDSIDYIAEHFASCATHFYHPIYISPPPSSTQVVSVLVDEATSQT